MKNDKKDPRTRFHIHNNYRDSGKLTPLIFFAIIAGVVFCLLLILDLIFKPDGVDILVEFHGLFFDLLIFGIILTIYDSWNRRRERIDTLHDQLDDYWDWKSEEGVLRKVGILKRLIELNHPTPRMTAIFLSGADFFNMEFTRLIFQNSTLEQSKFNWSKLDDCFFASSNFRNSDLEHSKFSNSTISDTDLEGSNLKFCEFGNCDIRGGVRFNNSNLHCVDFSTSKIRPEAGKYPDFTGADISEANLCGVDLSACIGLTREQIESARTDENTKLPEYL